MSAWQEMTYPTDKAEKYALLETMLSGLMEGEHDLIANMANMSALLFDALEEVNWAGFYRMQEGMLVLGPFQGKPACIRIPLGRGVCGTAAANLQTQLVKDVHLFPGHIACDALSQSEVVIPLIRGGELLGVLDIDSPVKNRFDEMDQAGLEKLCEMLCKA